jgi:hypothetical protein
MGRVGLPFPARCRSAGLSGFRFLIPNNFRRGESRVQAAPSFAGRSENVPLHFGELGPARSPQAISVLAEEFFPGSGSTA